MYLLRKALYPRGQRAFYCIFALKSRDDSPDAQKAAQGITMGADLYASAGMLSPPKGIVRSEK